MNIAPMVPVLAEAVNGLSPSERPRVAAFLETATAILATTATDDDPLLPDGRARVGLSVRSDGTWIWSDAHTYYAKVHGIAPDPELLAHIRARGYRCEAIDADRASEVLDAFYTEVENEPGER